MKLFFKFLLILFTSVYSFAFDVRVLLNKAILDQNKTTHVEISSSHGMTIPGVKNILNGSVSIKCNDKGFVVNGVSTKKECLKIEPVLSGNHNKKIEHFVAKWMKKEKKECEEQLATLHDFYMQFVTERGFKDYNLLYKIMQQMIDKCIKEFIVDVEYPSISKESLTEKSKTSLHKDFKNLFTTAIVEKKISKAFRKQLTRLPEVRNKFFIDLLEDVLSEFLQNFLKSLPHKIIKQALQEETGYLFFDKNKYLGTFYLLREEGKILLINSLDIDDYLLSVVRSEGWPGWPLEVNKALVVASRTYLLSRILAANKANRSYHIVNSIKHQTYKGHHKFMKLKKAVDETRDIFIAYNGEPIEAMFDSCCGGVVPSKISTINFKKHPYLARKKQCNYCKKCWIYRWKKELSKTDIAQLLKKEYPEIKIVKDISVVDRDDAGIVKRVAIKTPNDCFYLSGKKIYSLFPCVKSFCYTIKRKGRGFLIQGRGYGHHIGLCQWGALNMVNDHWNYKKILQFYYPKTEFMKLSLSR